MRWIQLVAVTLAYAVAPVAAGAQATNGMGMQPDTMSAQSMAAAQVAHESMEGAMPMASAHMRMTPPRVATAADSARAAREVKVLHAAIAKYGDYRVAEADGYKPFLPNVRQQVYHFTSRRRALLATVHFDPARPTSLLYRKTGSGYELVGAMFTAPRSASLEELDRRFPLGIAQWHEHTNICIPARAQRDRAFEQRDGTPIFGPRGSIATAQECAAEGGRFFPVIFGWMVHVPAGSAAPSAAGGSVD